MKIMIKHGSITGQDADAIVNPANSFGYMGGGVAEAIKKVGGKEIEEEAISHAPVEIGTALATTAGSLRCSCVIHSPTMRNPAEKTDVSCVEEAVAAALELADAMKLRKLAMPGMGTGVGMVRFKDAAEAMLKAIKEFNAKYLEEIVLVDINEEMIEAWKELV